MRPSVRTRSTSGVLLGALSKAHLHEGQAGCRAISKRGTAMTKRRGKGEGSIRERADGRWEVRIDLGRALDGKRRQKSAFAKTQAEAVQQLRKLGGRAAEGQLLTTSTPTVTRFLEDWYGLNSDSWRPSTRRGYRAAIDNYLVKAFGPLRLE